MNLQKILEYYNLDTDKNSIHSYVSGFYEETFRSYKDLKINILEIGIFNGGSIFLWKEYFKNANIYALDINNSNLMERYKGLERVRYFFEDAYNDIFSQDQIKFDIAIDDGPHTLESQIKFITKFLPMMNKNGIMIIEDVQDISWAKYLQSATDKQVEIIDLRGIKGRYDDILAVIKT